MKSIVNVKFIKSHQDEILELADVVPKCIFEHISERNIEEYFEYNKENSDSFQKEYETIDEWLNSQDLVIWDETPEEIVELLKEWVECYPQFEEILNRQYFEEFIENDGVLNQSEELKRIEINFHKLIMHRAGNLIEKFDVEMPHVTFDLLEKDGWINRESFPVPGMYGGFYYYLSLNDEGQYELNVDSWSRICGGSGQTHIITEDKCELIDEGFV